MAKTHRYYEVQLRKAGANHKEFWAAWFKSDDKESLTVQVTILGGELDGHYDWGRDRAEELFKTLINKQGETWYISKVVNPDAKSTPATGDMPNPQAGLGLTDEVDTRFSQEDAKRRRDLNNYL